MPIQSGRQLGAYRIEAPLGQGGMGTVYRAFDTMLQRPVAINVLSEADEQARGKLLAEARAASALDHPNVCTVHEVGEADGQPYIVMALVEGKPLSELIPSDGLPPESVIRYGLQIADALAHAHEKGIIHRDLKSQNVVITPEGRAKVSDSREIYVRRASNVWVISLDDGVERQVTDLSDGRRGTLASFTTDGDYVYLAWGEDKRDIWVMDVIQDEP